MADMDGDGEIELTEFTGTLLTGRVGGDCRVAGDIREGVSVRDAAGDISRESVWKILYSFPSLFRLRQSSSWATSMGTAK